MILTDFTIDTEFWCGGRQWRCTDVGTRVVVAIRIDQANIATAEHGVMTTRSLSREEAEAIGWFNGPPYGVVEQVFDEDDLQACSTDGEAEVPDELETKRRNDRPD